MPIPSWIHAWNEDSLEAWLRHFATDIWTRIAFCNRNERNRVFETTITQNMVYEFFKVQLAGAFPLNIQESKNEKINGNDLEIIIRTNKGYLIFPAQCKIVDKLGKYSTINHSSSTGSQIELLLDYGRRINGIPIYLLYNTSDDGHTIRQITSLWKDIPIQSFGCSFTDAQYVFKQYYKNRFTGEKKWTIPTFNDLHTTAKALPFEYLAYFADFNFMKDYKQNYSEHFDFITAFPDHLYHPSLSNDGWRSFIETGTIGRINPERIQEENNFSGEEFTEFSPAYRIIFDLLGANMQ